MTDRLHWHDGYTTANSALSRRLSVVVCRLSQALDAAASVSPRLLRLGAGDGRDVICALVGDQGALSEPYWSNASKSSPSERASRRVALVVPAEILREPGRLTAAEFELVKYHSQAGHDMVAGIDFPCPSRR